MKLSSTNGFTLLELIVVVTIVATLAGAAVPVTSKMLEYRAREATVEELQVLAGASVAYFRDTGEFPAELADLLVDPKRPGWVGPYLSGVIADRSSGESGFLVDAWSRGYRWQVLADVATISSCGRDAEFGTDADLEVDVAATPLRRAATLDRLRVINTAVRAYNDRSLATAPLASAWPQAFDQLVEAGLLPQAALYRQDAWGDAFVANPFGQQPVVAIDSLHLMTAAELGGSLRSEDPADGPRDSTGTGASARDAWPRRPTRGSR